MVTVGSRSACRTGLAQHHPDGSRPAPPTLALGFRGTGGAGGKLGCRRLLLNPQVLPYGCSLKQVTPTLCQGGFSCLLTLGVPGSFS